jgi:hypothetical protein
LYFIRCDWTGGEAMTAMWTWCGWISLAVHLVQMIAGYDLYIRVVENDGSVEEFSYSDEDFKGWYWLSSSSVNFQFR